MKAHLTNPIYFKNIGDSMKKTVFIGIDIGCQTFVSTILKPKSSCTEEFLNETEGFINFIKWLNLIE